MEDRPVVDVSDLEVALQHFADARDWNQFHSPKNLAMALTREAGEFVEISQPRSSHVKSHEGQKRRRPRAMNWQM
jgi:dCTP diphosphatase